MRCALAGAWLTIALGALGGCATTADAGDTTPPTVEFKYRFDDELWADVPSAGLSVDFDGDVLYLWAVGRDSGGVERVVIKGTGDVICRTGLANYSSAVSETAKAEEDSSVGDGDRTESSRNLLWTFPAGSACDDEADDYRSGSIDFVAKARNFAGTEVTSGTLTVSRD